MPHHAKSQIKSELTASLKTKRINALEQDNLAFWEQTKCQSISNCESFQEKQRVIIYARGHLYLKIDAVNIETKSSL